MTMQATIQPHPKSAPRRARRWRLMPVVLLGAALVGIGFSFAQFLAHVDGLAAPSDPQADGIVVVTGGQDRIEVALELLQSGAAQRLLISGVHADTTAALLAERTQVDRAVFDCCVDLDHAALDTAGNARETAVWANTHGFSSLLVVTSAYHIPRTTFEIEQRLPNIDLTAIPIDPARETHLAVSANQGTWSVALLGREYLKLQFARLRGLVGLVS